jgi:uncharacterized membrane protein
MTVRAMPSRPAPVIWPFFLLATFVLCFVISAIVPPFQAPDEFDHLHRAYMFSRGQVFLHSSEGKPSGGYIDSGLLRYESHFRPIVAHNDRKVSAAEEGAAGDVTWTGVDTRVAPVGTAYYFPLMYAPQAVALGFGSAMGLPVGQSYRLARLLTLTCCFGLIILAVRMFPPPPVLLALLALPMNVFLLAMPTLDGMTTSMTIVALASFMRIVADREATPRWIVYTFLASLFLVCACRANAAPLLILPFAAHLMLRDRRVLVGAVALALLSIGWTLYTIKGTVYPLGARHIDHAQKLLHYIVHPGQFFGILYSTLADPFARSYYADSFIGSLGWLDAPLPVWVYTVAPILLAGSLVFSISGSSLTEQQPSRLLLVICAIGILLMTFLAMLVQWTVGDSPIIQGVQGRYFMIPAVAVIFALAGEPRPVRTPFFWIATVFTALLMLLSAFIVTRTLVARYYIVPDQTLVAVRPKLAPSPILSPGREVQVPFSPAQVNSPAELMRIELMFGTYARSNPGQAKLDLWTNDGQHTSVTFDLKDLKDNGYKTFPVSPGRYVGARLQSIQNGEGVSIWQVTQDGPAVACIIYETTDDRLTLTPGCPAPAN